MSKINTVLFDFDGVIVDTESQYDSFSEKLAKRYSLPSHFMEECRGTTLDRIMEIYFKDLPEEEKNRIRKESNELELQMDFPWVEGVDKFIQYLKDNNYKIGLVTSSPDSKMNIALEKLGLTDTFDTKVTANRVTHGKPHPMCYLLGAKDLDATPEECVVFEDSLHGIHSANGAGMRVIGVSTTFTEEKLKEQTHGVIANFKDIEKTLQLLK